MTASPAGEGSTPRPVFDWLIWLALAAVAGAYIRAIFFTPPEALQGYAQKIYYIHVSAALNAYLAFGVVFVASIVHLWLGDVRADRLAEASAEVGLLFTTVVLTTGPMWARPIWGTWWTWDARLTATLFLWFLYASYLVLRGAIDDPHMRARYSAVTGIMGAILIPFIHLSVYLFRTLHPMPILLKPSAPSMPGDMVETFLIAWVAFTLLCIALLRARYRYGELKERAAMLEAGR